MNSYWIKFSDGSEACCQGQNDYDARRIAEKVSGKTVEGSDYEGGPNVKPLPYPALPVIWRLDHPVHGKTPTFCHSPTRCAGRTSCAQARSCVD